MEGLNLVVETRLYNLSMRGTACNILNNDTNYKSKCQYNIPDMIERDESIEHINFSIPYAVIPVSFYTVNENNNKLIISINSAVTIYTFPFGNYSANTFITEFKLLLGGDWTITLNTFNSVFTVTNSVNDFTILGSSSISSIIGFTDDCISTSKTLIFPRCCNFLPLPRITLRCPQLANTTVIGAINSSDVVITIPNNSKPNGQIYYLNQMQTKLLFRHHEINRFVILLTDDDGNFINFNGISSFFTLQFDIYRKWTPKPPRFSDIVNMVNNHNYFPEEEPPVEDNI